jgi:hypothetical protein
MAGLLDETLASIGELDEDAVRTGVSCEKA